MQDKITYTPFSGFNPYKKVHIYQRRLPHWRQDGCTYFVTFRLADSIPAKIMKQWAEERTHWFQCWKLDGELPHDEFARKYRAIPKAVREHFEREQMRKPLKELDKCHGSCILRNPVYANCVSSGLQFYDGRLLQCGDFVVMPNHVHWIVMPLKGVELEDVVGRVKGYTSREFGKTNAEHGGQVWQAENYDRCIRDRQELFRTQRYIEKNPEAGCVGEGQYLYFRAEWLNG